MANPQYQDFVETVVKALVDNPDKVSTERTVDERGVLITLNLDSSDMGYVIGKQGQNAKAIRTLLRLVGARNDARVTLKINEPEGSVHRSVDRNAPRNASRPRPTPVATEDVSVDDLKI
ncbi:KH domain-containing protein [Candidatus Parcubacteria bacterium]|nr:KH domain-containing protein [Patescibacteria group bacterium]MBU4482286.1 KH domain-containing protein [Patescibacteria group bacterium]MCG2686852.1 KH domain-containing protein [Candidatus Parcubacteria bacterium]